MSLSPWHDLRSKEAAENRALVNKHAGERASFHSQYVAGKIAMASRHSEEKADLTMQHNRALEAYREAKRAPVALLQSNGRPARTLDRVTEELAATRRLMTTRSYTEGLPEVRTSMETALARLEAERSALAPPDRH